MMSNFPAADDPNAIFSIFGGLGVLMIFLGSLALLVHHGLFDPRFPLRQRVSDNLPRCPKCDYILVEPLSNTCPECGHDPAADVRKARKKYPRWPWVLIAYGVLYVAVVPRVAIKVVPLTWFDVAVYLEQPSKDAKRGQSDIQRHVRVLVSGSGNDVRLFTIGFGSSSIVDGRNFLVLPHDNRCAWHPGLFKHMAGTTISAELRSTGKIRLPDAALHTFNEDAMREALRLAYPTDSEEQVALLSSDLNRILMAAIKNDDLAHVELRCSSISWLSPPQEWRTFHNTPWNNLIIGASQVGLFALWPILWGIARVVKHTGTPPTNRVCQKPAAATK